MLFFKYTKNMKLPQVTKFVEDLKKEFRWREHEMDVYEFMERLFDDVQGTKSLDRPFFLATKSGKKINERGIQVDAMGRFGNHFFQFIDCSRLILIGKQTQPKSEHTGFRNDVDSLSSLYGCNCQYRKRFQFWKVLACFSSYRFMSSCELGNCFDHLSTGHCGILT